MVPCDGTVSAAIRESSVSLRGSCIMRVPRVHETWSPDKPGGIEETESHALQNNTLTFEP